MVPPGSNLVEVDLIEQPDGTLLRLTHTSLPNTSNAPMARPITLGAGRGCTECDPGPDPWHGRTGAE